MLTRVRAAGAFCVQLLDDRLPSCTVAAWADWCKKAERSAQTGEEVCRPSRHNVRALSVSGPKYKADCRQQATSLQSRCIALAASCLRCFRGLHMGRQPGAYERPRCPQPRPCAGHIRSQRPSFTCLIEYDGASAHQNCLLLIR